MITTILEDKKKIIRKNDDMLHRIIEGPKRNLFYTNKSRPIMEFLTWYM